MAHDPSSLVMRLVEKAIDSGRSPEQVCTDYPQLIDEVTRLWQQCRNNEVALDALFAMPSSPRSSGLDSLGHNAEAMGQMIGPYRLLKQIGEGGFGVVFLAEQKRPIRRQVALKLIKAGMDTKEVIARFEAERQALAVMDHPNIARVFDAGETATGRPFFIMEYVDGVAITTYCDSKRLDLMQRLVLMVPVCRAVHSAHQKGVIHRDIKPSNLLVGEPDGVAMPKVIDFGVAKATTPDHVLTDRTLFTLYGGMIGTPSYMSPEQADPMVRSTDTRTDVYGLGSVLYELLTGVAPICPDLLKSMLPGEMSRLVRESELLAPSPRLGQHLDKLNDIAAARATTSHRLRQSLKGELEWVVMKALENNLSRRYDTAAALADDLTRLITGKPVRAGPVGMRYRLQRYVRKNKSFLSIALALFLTLLLGTIGTGFGLIREHRERQIAEQQRDEADVQRHRAKAVVDFLTNDVLAKASPKTTADRAVRDTLVKQLIEPALRTTNERFGNDPMLRAAVQNTLAKTLRDLGRSDLAIFQSKAAWDADRSTLGDDAPQTLVSLDEYATELRTLGRYGEALPLAEQAWQRAKKSLGDSHIITLRAVDDYALALTLGHRPQEAGPLLSDALRRYRNVLGPGAPDTLRTAQDYAVTLRDLHRAAEAEPLTRDVWQQTRRTLGDDHPATILALSDYAAAVNDLGRPLEAEPLARDAWQRSRTVQGDDHPDTLWTEHFYASILLNRHERANALPLLKDAAERGERILGREHPDAVYYRSSYEDAARMPP